MNKNIRESVVSVKNGRLVFSNVLILKEKVEELKEKGRKNASDELAKFTERGFTPLRGLSENPINLTNSTRSAFGTSTTNDYSGSIIEEDFDDFEETIGDDEFATLVNNNGEIQVADTIYKYTTAGLYYTHESTIQKLYDYLDTQNVGDIKLAPASYANDSGNLSGLCIVEKNDPYVKQIEPDIKYFAVESCSSVTYNTNVSGDATGTQTTSGTFDIDAFVSSLPECNSRSSFIGRAFGKSISCTSNFDDKHRIKTKFWDQDYKIYQSIGVAVKHQTKKVWIWWTTDTDELRLGINNAYFEYNLPSPNVVLENPALTLYVLNQKLYTSKGIFIKNVLGDPLFSDFPFDSSLNVIIDLRSLGFSQLNFTGDNFNKEPQKQIWNQAKAFLKNLNGQDAKELTIMGYLPQKVVVSHINKTREGINIKKIKKVFDHQYG